MPIPRIRTTTVGSYPIPDWLSALPSDQARTDAMRVVFDIQRQAGIDLPTEGELYRFEVNNPDTNGMINYYVAPMAGVRTRMGSTDWETFARSQPMGLRAKPADVACVQVDEANITGYPGDSDLAARAINLVLDRVSVLKAVYLCFGNYG